MPSSSLYAVETYVDPRYYRTGSILDYRVVYEVVSYIGSRREVIATRYNDDGRAEAYRLLDALRGDTAKSELML